MVNSKRIYISDYIKNQNIDEFLVSLSSELTKKKYTVQIIASEKQKRGEHIIKDENGIYLVLLEAKKESFTIESLIRVCKGPTDEQIFIIIFQAAFFKERKDTFKETCNEIKQILDIKKPA